ncbi:MAG TPA: tetratricopeptide repeat protein [Polyangia bacterium]|nr:tetratricopeptide repeat protein [Polyangia bacterium]
MDKDILMRLERGREHYENREYDKAETFLLEVAATTTGFADVMNMLGVIYHDRGQVALAQEYFAKAVEINPRYTEAALNLAVACNEQGLYEEARRAHEHVASLQPETSRDIEPFARGKLANMHADLGRAYAELQLHDKAIAQYREALGLSPEFADIRTRLGQLLKDAGQYEAALRELRKVKLDRPKYLPARISLGVTHFKMGELNQARFEWRAVLEQDPENRTAGMYLRMVDQLIAQAEAKAEGLDLEIAPVVREGGEQDAGAATAEGELDFSFDGDRSSVMPARNPDPEET